MVIKKLNRHHLLLPIIASISWNIVEWYDFSIYLYFSSELSINFFQNKSHNNNSLILIFIIFFISFITRPVGGAFFGYIADKYGRKRSLLISMISMTIATAMIGFLPTYTSIGFFAPICLLLLRMIQNFSVSGELIIASVFAMELAPKGEKGFFASLIFTSIYIGLFVGSGLSFIISSLMNKHQLNTFGWRIAFFVSVIFGTVSIILRFITEDSKEYLYLNREKLTSISPIKDSFNNDIIRIVCFIFISGALAISIYTLIGYLPSFFINQLKLSLNQSMYITLLSLIMLSLLVPVFGYISDKISPKHVLKYGLMLMFMMSFFVFYFSNTHIIIFIFLAELFLISFLAPIAGSTIYYLYMNVSKKNNCTSLSLGYNLSMTLFGGATPLILILLIENTKSNISPFLYLSTCAFISYVFMYKLQSIKK